MRWWRKLLSDVLTIRAEQAKIHRAMRLLTKQEWSLEFLVSLLNRAVKYKQQGCRLILRNKDGQELIIEASIPLTNNLQKKDEQLDVQAGNVTLDQLLNAADIQGIL